MANETYILFQSELTVDTKLQILKKCRETYQPMSRSSKVFVEVTQCNQLIQYKKHENSSVNALWHKKECS